MVMCLGQDADLRMAQLMPLPLTILSLAPVNPDWFYLPGFTFLVLAHPGSPGQNPKGHKTVVYVCVQKNLRIFFCSTVIVTEYCSFGLKSILFAYESYVVFLN